MRHIWRFSTQQHCVCFEECDGVSFAKVYEVAPDGARLAGCALGFNSTRQQVVKAAIMDTYENYVTEVLQTLYRAAYG